MDLTQADILITNSNSFIGAAFALNLAQRHLHIVCLDNNTANTALTTSDHIEFINLDLLDADALDTQVARCTKVLHLPRLPDAESSNVDTSALLDTNIMGTRNVMQSCLRNDRPLLFMTEAEGQGFHGKLSDTGQQPFSTVVESVSKHYANALAEQGLKFVHLCFYGVYGSVMHGFGDGGVISQFLGNIKAGEALELVDGGNMIRSFCHVEDAAEAVAKVILKLELDAPDAPYYGTSVDIGHIDPLTISELAKLMAELSNHQAGTTQITEQNARKVGLHPVSPLLADTTTLANIIDFEPGIDLTTGLSRILADLGLSGEPSTPADNSNQLPNIRPHFEVDNNLGERIQHILISGQATNGGRYQQALEQQLADWLGVDETVVVSNGADALSLVLATSPARPAAKAILPSYTFIATLNAVIGHGLAPVFCDIDPETFTLCPKALARLLDETENVAWIVPVNVFGVPADIDAITTLAKNAGVEVLYDNAHGFGCEVNGARILKGPTAQTISMHATKVMPGVEGGIIISENAALLGEIRQMRNHGIAANPLLSIAGQNSKMDEVRAAIALKQWQHIDTAIERRRDYGNYVRGLVSNTELENVFQLQHIPQNVRSNFQNHGVLCPAAKIYGRDEIVDAFNAQGVGARPYFHPALHRLERYSDKTFNLPNTERIWRDWICLPLYARMSQRELNTIKSALYAVAEQYHVNPASYTQTMATGRSQTL